MKRAGLKRDTGRARGFDLEALGLVLLALGVFATGVLLPFVPSGELGAAVRNAQLDRFGWAAYPLPLPLLVLGALFLMRKSPPWWPRALAGFILLLAGAWGLSVGLLPGSTGSWGAAVRSGLGSLWGTLAGVPAFVLATLGVDLLVGWRPLRLISGLLRGIFRAVRAAANWLVETRKNLKRRAAVQADVAQARKVLTELDRDLVALSELYPGSAELERWRGDVRQTVRSLASPTELVLKEARADVRAWQGAVKGFTKDRAAELSHQLESEIARPPSGVGTLTTWAEGVGRSAGEPLLGEESVNMSVSKACAAAERVRKALALDLVALVERQRRLARDRDHDQRDLKRMAPRRLAGAYRSHQLRIKELREIGEDATALEEHVAEFEAWRDLMGTLVGALQEYPEYGELHDYDRTLARELDGKGRGLLQQDRGWSEALTSVLERAAAHAQEEEAKRLEWERQEKEREEQERLLATAPTAGRAGVDAHHAPTAFTATAVGTAPGTGLTGEHDPQVERALLGDQEAARAGNGTTSPVETPATATTAGNVGPVVITPATEPTPTPDSQVSSVPEYGAIEIQVPPIDLLDTPDGKVTDRAEVEKDRQNRIRQIDETLANFGLGGRVVEAVRGPTVTRFEVEPAPGEKISRFANLSDDLALAMAVGSVRIEAPIPGKSVIGLEVPNAYPETVRFREAVTSREFRTSQARMPVVLGRSIEGEMWIGDLTRMPHLLIAGSTGSGKSVAVNTLISSLLYRFLPTELRFLMIDPKMVELTPYDGIPHLLRPVVTNPGDAAGVLLGAVTHMERRYKMMSKIGARNLDQYNEKAENLDMPPLPLITIIIDELADLMITSPKEVESAIMRLAQMARATGMHLILATQRPSVDILTSLIKVNVPARMAFAVSSGHDSRTILDSMGAERLTGQGDMLFYQPGLPKAVRLQGPFVSEWETSRLADFLKRQYFDDDFVEAYGADFEPVSPDESEASGLIDWNDEKLRVAAELVVNEGQASVSRLQRRLSVGHARAGKLMDSLEGLGVVGPHQGSKPREVLVPMEELPNIFGS